MATDFPIGAKVVAFALVAVILASFLAVDVGGWDPVGPLRFLFIPTFAAIAVAAAAIGASRAGGRWSAPVGWIWCGLLCWLAIAAFFAVDPLHAWIGTPDRHFGFITWLMLAAVWLAALQLGERARMWCVLAVTAASAACGMWALLELFDAAPIDRSFDVGRLGGPFAQPAYFGAAMALATPISVGVAVDAWFGELGDSDRRPVAAAIGVLGAVGGLFGLVASQSRAAWVGTLVVAIVALWHWRHELVDGFDNRAVRLVAAAAALIGIVVVVVTPIGGRIASLVDTGGVIDGRTDEWAVAVRALGASPLVGHGPEGYRVVFGEHVDAAYAIEHGRTVITDRAHNGLLDVGVAAGIPGLLLYAGLIGFVFVAAWRAMKSEWAVEVGLATGVAAYFLAQLFLFPAAELDVAVWVLVGVLFGMGTSDEPTTVPSATNRIALLAASGVAAVFAIVAAVAGTLDVAADRRVASATAALTRDDPTVALADADRARELRPDSIRYHFIAARVAERVVLPQGFTAALERLDEGLERSPRDPALTSEQAEDALDLARATRSETDLQQAQTLAADVVASDPMNPQNQLRLGIVLGSVGDAAGAEEALREAVRLGPMQGEPRFNLAVLLMQEGRLEEARKEAEAAAAVEPASASDVAALIEEIDRRTGAPTSG